MMDSCVRKSLSMLLALLLTASLTACQGGKAPSSSVAQESSAGSDTLSSSTEATLPPEPDGHRVVFESAGGTPVESVIVRPGERLEKPADPVKEGFLFTGWTHGGNLYDFDSPVGNDLMLIAGWELAAGTKAFTIYYNSTGGSKLPSVEVSEGRSVEPPVEPTREGYRFLGWFLGEKKYDFSTPVTADIVLKARWEALPPSPGSSVPPSSSSAPGESSLPPQESKWLWEDIAGTWYLTGSDDVTVTFTLEGDSYAVAYKHFTLYPMPRLEYLAGGGSTYPAIDEDVTEYAEYVGFTRQGDTLVFQGEDTDWVFYRQKNHPAHVVYYLEEAYKGLPGIWYLQGSDRITITVEKETLNGEKGLQITYSNLKQIGMGELDGGRFESYYWLALHMDTVGMTYQNDTVILNRKGQKAVFVRTPTPKRVTGVTLDKSAITEECGQGGYLYAQVEPADASNLQCTWKSSDPVVATVDEAGMYSFHKPGTAVITVTTADGGFQASCTVTVLPYAVRGVALDKNSLSMTTGQDAELRAEITPWNAANQELVWESSNPAVAKVSSNGKTCRVMAVGEGSAVITVTTREGGFQASCTITAKDPPLTLEAKMSYALIIGGQHMGKAIILNGRGNGGSGGYSYDIRLYRDGVLLDEALGYGSLDSYSYYTVQKGAYRAEITLRDSRGRTVTGTAAYTIQ